MSKTLENQSEWNESFETHEDEDSRIHFYQQVCDGDDTTSYNELSSFVKLIRNGKLNTKPVSLPSLKAEQEAKWKYHKICIEDAQSAQSIHSAQPAQPQEEKPKGKFAWKLPIVQETKKNDVEQQEEEKVEEPQKLPRLLARGKASEQQQRVEETPKKSPVRHEGENQGKSSSVFKNTKMCKHGTKCSRQGCNYAHTLKDFSPVPCKFKSCRKGNSCTFFHSELETKEAFLQRISGFN